MQLPKLQPQFDNLQPRPKQKNGTCDEQQAKLEKMACKDVIVEFAELQAKFHWLRNFDETQLESLAEIRTQRGQTRALVDEFWETILVAIITILFKSH